MTDALICDAIRTPFGRYGGALASIRADDLGAIPLRELVRRNPKLDPAAVDDVILGCANQAGEDNRNVARMSALLSGLPESVPGTTTNRLCGSGMDAVMNGARSIQTGACSVVLAGGVESMSRAPYVIGKADVAFSRTMKLQDTTLGWRFINPVMETAYGVDSMVQTAENVAAEDKVSRGDQDSFAFRSQRRAAAALHAGIHKQEIVGITIPHKRSGSVVISEDEHPRPDTTLEGLAKLNPILGAAGTVTAGNASGISDGSAALLLASPAAANRFGLKPIARILAAATAGVPPRLMGVGPVEATRKVLSLTGLFLHQIDVIELNEAFAAQAIAVLRRLGLPEDAPHVNPNGGAIALGHPLGASGVRLVMTAANQLRRTSGHYALCTMCIGVGQGISMIVERI
jgi:3-oxoadipyl-CoA thiolase